MKALLACALLLAGTARAQDTDAPVAMKQGDVAPADGVFLTTARAGKVFQDCETAQKNAAAFQQALETQPVPQTSTLPSLLLAGGVGLVIGAIVTLVVVGVKSAK